MTKITKTVLIGVLGGYAYLCGLAAEYVMGKKASAQIATTSGYVTKSGAQTITGTKTFTQTIISTVASGGTAYRQLTGARLCLATGATSCLTGTAAGTGTGGDTTGMTVPGQLNLSGLTYVNNNDGLFGNVRINMNPGITIQTDPITFTSYTDDSTTAGNRTVNQTRGKNAFASGTSAVTITNSRVTTDSQVIATLEELDGAIALTACVPAAGSFTCNLTANATADRTFSWLIIR